MYNIDADPKRADWLRSRWHLPKYKSKAFYRALEDSGTTLAEFKRMPIYQFAVEQGRIRNDKWVDKPPRSKK